MQACDRCHARKTRCDRRIPQCSACEKASVPCLHADKLRQRNLPRAYIDNMEALVSQLREENQVLRRDLAEAQARAGSVAENQGQLPSQDCATQQQQIQSVESHSHAPIESPGAISSLNAIDGGRAPEPTRADTSYTFSATKGSKGSSLDNNPFAVEVGYLTLTATGESRYLGPSSGIDLASIISKVVSAQSGVPNMFSFGDAPTGGGTRNYASSSSDRHTDSTSPSASRGPVPRPHQSIPSDMATLFPTLAYAMPFIESYFQLTHLTFPLLHRPSFMAMAGRICSEPGYYEANTYDAFVFDMVVSIGSSNVNRFEEAASGIARKCFAMAQSKIKTVFQMHGLASLKAILLICYHGIFSSHCDTSANVWHLVGIGARLCIELGLHLKQRRRHISVTTITEPEIGVVTLDEEMRRRCFWCLYNFDRMLSCIMGRPVVIRDEELNVPLPSPLDDDLFGQDRPIVVHGSTENPTGSTAKNGDTGSASNEKASPFLHFIQIHRISGQILGYFYNSRHLECAPVEEKRRVRREFEMRLQEWSRRTKDLNFPTYSKKANSPGFLAVEWFHALYSDALLLLYRPSPSMPHPAAVDGARNEIPDLLKMFHASRNSIISYSEMHRIRRLNYSWITLHVIFIAGLAFVYSASRILQDPTLRNLVPDLVTIVDTTRACSNVLSVICERWKVSRPSCELFNKLSNAVIQDAFHNSLRHNEVSCAPISENFLTSLSTSTPRAPTVDSHFTELPRQALPRNDRSTVVAAAQPLDEMLLMDEFRLISDTLETSANTNMEYPSEMVFGFVQDWPFDLPFGTSSAAENMSSGW